MKSFAVTYGNSTKKITVTDPTYGNITRSVKEVFKMETQDPLLLKYYDAETDSFIDVDDEEESCNVPKEAVKILVYTSRAKGKQDIMYSLVWYF